MDYKIGEYLWDDGVLYRGVKFDFTKMNAICSLCAFNGRECKHFECHGNDRKDGESVYLVKVPVYFKKWLKSHGVDSMLFW